MPSFAIDRTELLDALHEDVLAAVTAHYQAPNADVMDFFFFVFARSEY